MDKTSQLSSIEIARKTQEACIRAAKEEFQQALMSGLCNEGAIEAAVGAIQSLDLEKIIQKDKAQ